MDQKSPKITSEQLVKLLMEKCPELGEKIIAALNDAPDDHWISRSEEQVRDAGHAFVKAGIEAAVQQNVAAADATFPLLPQDSRGNTPRNQGLQQTTDLTILGRISIRRRWWHSSTDKSFSRLDDGLTPARQNVAVGGGKDARLNGPARSCGTCLRVPRVPTKS